MLKQRFKSSWGISGDSPSADRRDVWVTATLEFSEGDVEGETDYTHLLLDYPNRLKAELLRCGTVLKLRFCQWIAMF